MQKKEFASLRYKSGPQPPYKTLTLATQQLFVSRWMHPNEKHDLLFVQHDPGSGKTIAALNTAMNFMKLFKLLNKGRVIIIGFQKNTFLTEIMRRPELGFITEYEYEKLNSLKGEEYDKYYGYLKKKITNPEYGGYVRFFGYQELYNAIFETNKEIINIFEGSFVICDEIHNVYNSVETNSYGETITYIRKYFEEYELKPKFLFLSATPLNNKPTEIIDLLNLIHYDKKLKVEDFFTFNNSKSSKSSKFENFEKFEKFENFEKIKFTSGALKKIGLLSNSYFSFYVNNDPLLMPSYKFIGDYESPLFPKEKEKNGYLKFFRIKISEEYKKIFPEKIKFEDVAIYDGYLNIEGRFYYKTSDHKYIKSASEEWRKKNDIDFSDVIYGGFLNIKNLKIYFPKYAKLIEILIDYLKTKSKNGNVLIYHPNVYGTGIKFIEQILIQNGFISEFTEPNENTICINCGETKEKHKKCNFEPTRFTLFYGELDKKNLKQTMQKFNSEENKEGKLIKIIIGSDMIREGYDFKSLSLIIISHLVQHISALIQIIGRGVRMYSHEYLENNIVEVAILACDREIEKYNRKIYNYKMIQEILREIHKNAVDINIFYDINKKTFVKNALGELEFNYKPIKHKIDNELYDIFYGDWEVSEIKKIIHSLFLLSRFWTLEDLWEAVKNPPFVQFVDCSLFEYKNFILALGDMIYRNYIINNPYPLKICYMYNSIEKKNYYCLYPIKNSTEKKMGFNIFNRGIEPVINKTSCFLDINNDEIAKIPINEDLLSLNINYEEMKYKFYKKFKDVNMLQIPASTEVYGMDFHIKLIEECITYIYKLFLKKTDKSEFHEFYFKMVHFYNKIGLILYANMIPDKYKKYYENYLGDEIETSSLLVSINNATSSISSFEITEINKFLEKKNKKIPANILPVGHLLTANRLIEPKLYNDFGWFFINDFVSEDINIKENDIIIGYYEKSSESINFKFKLRLPKHLIPQTTDKRNIEKGAKCETKKKEELEQICVKLGITPPKTSTDICLTIKEELIYKELKDRNKFRKGQVSFRTRWCYMQYEKDPFNN